MSKVIKLISIILILISSGCEQYLGGYIFDGIYFYENGNMINAQGYTIRCSANGGILEFNIISEGISGIVSMDSNVDWISEGDFPDYPPDEEDKYESSDRQKMYLQNVSLSISPNNTGRKRMAEICFVTGSLFAHAAKVTVIQVK